MFTPEMLQQAHETTKAVLQVIFQYEDDFKKRVLQRCGWRHDSFEIERCHAAQNFRLTLKRDDGRERDIYIPSQDVYDWFLTLQDEVMK